MSERTVWQKLGLMNMKTVSGGDLPLEEIREIQDGVALSIGGHQVGNADYVLGELEQF